MPNRNLTSDELVKANSLLREIRVKLETLSGGDPELLFAFRRKVFKELTYDERSTPTVRKALKVLKRKEQHDLCEQPLPKTHTVLDRKIASAGYTAENTELICQTCDTARQTERRYHDQPPARHESLSRGNLANSIHEGFA
jgi:hypothetical protein